MNSSTDRIDREIVLKVPRSRVWRALANAAEFGKWFGVDLKGKTFASGKPVKGHITHPGYEHLMFDAVIQLMVPERLLSLRWHPYAIDPAYDYSKEPTTLVEFTLEDVTGGTLLKVVESGFDSIPASRREEAYRMNSGGWDAQMKNIAKHIQAEMSVA
jgi:uncharacterized protein YndB with AHSA1/START domain